MREILRSNGHVSALIAADRKRRLITHLIALLSAAIEDRCRALENVAAIVSG